MILEGNQRGGARNLALHLLKEENDQVEVHELRGFISDNLVSALDEARAVSRGTKATKFLFSLSLNPPPQEQVPSKTFLEAIDRTEEKLGLEGQPRAIVFHVKEGRRHCHAVWSRIDGKAMKAIPLPHTKMKLMDLSRDLYFENGWKMPKGFIRKQDRSPDNFTLAQWQQSKRTGQDPRAIKATLRDSWASTKTQGEFVKALKDQGYALARGDRRAFVIVDKACETYSLPRWLGLKTKDVKSRLTDDSSIKPVADVKAKIAQDMKNRLAEAGTKQEKQIEGRLSHIAEKKAALKMQQRVEWANLVERHEARQRTEAQTRQNRFRKGLGGFFDFVTGKKQAIRKQNEAEHAQCQVRDRTEKDKLIFSHLEQTQGLQKRGNRLEEFREQRKRMLEEDMRQYDDIRLGRRDHFERNKNERGPTRER